MFFSDLLRLQTPKNTSESIESKANYNYWTDEQVTTLKDLYMKGLNVSEMSEALERSERSVSDKIYRLNLKRFKLLTVEQEQFLKRNYWILGNEGCAKKLNRTAGAISYYAKKLHLKIPERDQYDPPIYRSLLPYEMAKRICILQRKSPTSKTKVDDAVVIFYDTYRPAKPLAAVHLDELCCALDRHFGRREGVTAGALINGWKQ